MTYTELIIEIDRRELDLLTAELAEMGITATQVEDPAVVDEIMAKKQAYEWDYIDPALAQADRGAPPRLHVYFADDPEGSDLLKQVQDKLTQRRRQGAAITWDMRRVDDEDWVHSYKEHFKSHWLTDHILVCPSWERGADEKLAGGDPVQVLELDPGMAFGTGDHATTYLCARLMERAGCEGKTVLDIGTGSGILAIAAALMGGERSLGVDIDPVAVEVARSNVEKNNCQDRVTIAEGDLTLGLEQPAGVPVRGDLMVANLMAELILMLAPHVSRHLNPGGCFIASGILTEKRDMVFSAIEEAGMKVEAVLEEEGWCALMARI